MKRQDARKLDHKTLEAIRVRAVQRVQSGESPEVVVSVLGFSRACIYNWLAAYRSGGWGSLKARKLYGRPHKLRGPQIQWIQSYVTDNKIYCVYRAPNEFMIREHAQRGGFPANKISQVRRTIDPTTAE